jgi:hypothetical protein
VRGLRQGLPERERYAVADGYLRKRSRHKEPSAIYVVGPLCGSPVNSNWERTMARQTLKEDFLDRAKDLSKEREIYRCTLLTSLISESIPFGVCAEGEFFVAAYGDPAGRAYWDAHLSEPILVGKFAYLSSVHLPLKADQLETVRTAIILALRDAAAAGERWFIGDTAPLLAFEGRTSDFETLVKIKVRPRRAVEWLLSKPKREHLVPSSLRAFLEVERDHSAAQTNPPRVTRKNADRFAAEYINGEKAARRRPTLAGFEAAARNAGLRGGREILRDAFRRSPDAIVMEGRPRKLAK